MEEEGIRLPSSLIPLTRDSNHVINEAKEKGQTQEQHEQVSIPQVLSLTGDNNHVIKKAKEEDQSQEKHEQESPLNPLTEDSEAEEKDREQHEQESPVFSLTGDNEAKEKHRNQDEQESPVLSPNGDNRERNNKGEKDPEQHEQELTVELCSRIVQQVEYYFSDENLPTDKFMLKYVKNNKGFVPIGVIASFRKMKKLVKDDVSIIVTALKTSTMLVLSSDGKKVRRLNPLPNISNMKDPKFKTVIVENLPEDYSEESMNKMFSGAGKVVNIKFQGSESEEGLIYGKKSMMSTKIHALVEYTSVEEAEKAVVTLNDRTNWKRGIRVELLQKRKGFGKFENFAIIDKEAQIINGNKDNLKDNKGNNKNRRKYYNKKGSMELGHGSGTIGSSSEIAIKPLQGPKMPDGTKGFAMGRGRPLNCENKTKGQDA